MGKNQRITRTLGKLLSLQQNITFILAVVVSCIVVFQVILRYVLKAPLMGIEELLIFPTIWLYLLSGANASQQRNHIECGVLTLYIKKQRSMKLFKIFKALTSLTVGLWLLYWSYWFFEYSLKHWKTSDLLYIPMFFGESALFVGIALMCLYAFIELAGYIKDFISDLSTEKRGEIKC